MLGIANHVACERIGPDREALWIIVGINLGKAPGNHIYVCCRGLQSHTGLAALLANEISRAIVFVPGLGRVAAQTQREINGSAEIPEPRRHDADKGSGLAIQR